jgi:cytochrome c oxidase subunit 2
MFNGASSFIESVDGVFLFTIIVSVFFLVLITALMIGFVIKYSRKKNLRAVNIKGNTKLEILWTAIPTILVLIMFWYGWIGYLDMVNVPEDAMPVDVTAQMWSWKFKYSNGMETDSLYVPVNQPVKLNLKSNDVSHSFFVPAFRIKKDVYPGTERVVWFNATEIGKYDIACAEYCGLNHSYMYSKIHVLSQEDFDNWFYGISEEDQKLLDEMTNDNEDETLIEN